jgi:hypothetical protein
MPEKYTRDHHHERVQASSEDAAANLIVACLLPRSLLGVKRTCPVALHMSAFDPKRTSASISCRSSKADFGAGRARPRGPGAWCPRTIITKT